MTLFARWSILSRARYPVQITFAELDAAAQLPRTLLHVARSIAFKTFDDSPQLVSQRREFLL
jgi:hypothetical protein